MNVKELDGKYVAGTYARFPVVLKEGKGSLVWDEDGKEYIDMGSGIAVNAFGIADPVWAAAVSEQLGKLQHCSNLYFSEPCAKLAEALCERTGMKKVFFGNSGAEANECAIKAARKYAADKYGPERCKIVTLINSFHGRTIATLTATGQEDMHRDFQPLVPGFIYTPANDCEALRKLVAEHDDIAAFMFELVQGEGGVMPLEQSFVDCMVEIAKAKDILLVCDEVQTGNGRTGSLYAWMQYGFKPDIMSTAKGLGGGLPIGACLCAERLAGVMGPGMHGSTFGGNPVVCAGARVVLNRLASPGFLDEVAEKGEYLRSRLTAMPHIAEVRGMGLMRGAVLDKGTAREAAERCLEGGLLVLTAKTLLRFLPPLTITKEELDRGLAVLESVLKTL